MIIDILKSILYGIVQGITEWLPISSTGHMILLDEFAKLNVSEDFWNLFLVVIQLGSIIAVLTLYFSRLNPFSRKKNAAEKKRTWSLWSKIIVAMIPVGIIGVLFDDFIDAHLHSGYVVAGTLILYGILFIIIERFRKNKKSRVEDAEDISYGTALEIGAFQMLSVIPGTSRSGSTILGAMLVGVSRTAAAEFSFFLAVPVMFGARALKIFKYVKNFGLSFTTTEIVVLLVGMLVAFLVSVAAIKFLVNFVRRHSFESFGWYRIVLGIIVILYFIFLK